MRQDITQLRYRNCDKRKTVKMLLNNEECSKWSNRKIAETCGVSHTFVSKIRKEMLNTPHAKTEKPSNEN